MAASEDTPVLSAAGENNTAPQTKASHNDKIKFKDPLMTGLDKDSDDDGVRLFLL